MNLACPGCNGNNIQKIDVLLATGTQETVTEHTKKSGTIFMPITMLAREDLKTGKKSVSVTESSLVKLVRSKLEVLEKGDKPLVEAYKKAVAEQKTRESQAEKSALLATSTPDLDYVNGVIKKLSIAAVGVGAVKSLLFSGFSIWGMAISGIIFGVVGLIIMKIFSHFGLHFFKPQLAQKLDEQRQAAKSAVENAKSAVKLSHPEPIKPVLGAEQMKEAGYFCHSCGELFLPQK